MSFLTFRTFTPKRLIALFLMAIFTAATAQEESVLLDRIIAVVQDDAVMQSELSDRMVMIKRRFTESSEQLPPDNLLQQQVLERIVVERLQLQLAKRRSIQIDELTLNEAMRSVAQRNRLSLPEFRDRLVSEDIDYVKFREQIRTELTIDKLRARVIDRKIQITDQEVEDLIASQAGTLDQESEYHLRHILISVPEAASSEQVRAARKKIESIRQRAIKGENFAQLAISESNGQKALEGGDLGWRNSSQIPTIFSRAVTTMSPGDISEAIRSPSGYHLIKLQAHEGGRRNVINQTRARHILIKTTAVVDDDAALQRLNNIFKRIESGEKFSTLAKANSDDDGSAVQGGDLGWMSPGDLVPEFEEVMDNLDVEKISEPFKSKFGWHIVQVLERREHDDTDEAMQTQARDIIRRRKVEEETELWLRRLRDESYVEYRLEPADQS